MARKKPPSAGVLEELRSKSSSFAELSSILSHMLVQADRFFADMPGKAEAHVDRGLFRLSLERMGRGWGLFIVEFESVDSEVGELQRVTQAPIRLKAVAAQLLPQLYALVTEQIESSFDMVNEGLSALHCLPFLDIHQAQEEYRQQLQGDYGDEPEPSTEGGFPDDEIPF